MKAHSHAGSVTRRWPWPEQGLNIIGVKESDPRFGAPDIALERSRAMTGGPGGGPVNDKAAENVELLDQVCFIVRLPMPCGWPAAG